MFPIIVCVCEREREGYFIVSKYSPIGVYPCLPPGLGNELENCGRAPILGARTRALLRVLRRRTVAMRFVFVAVTESRGDLSPRRRIGIHPFAEPLVKIERCVCAHAKGDPFIRGAIFSAEPRDYAEPLTCPSMDSKSRRFLLSANSETLESIETYLNV